MCTEGVIDATDNSQDHFPKDFKKTTLKFKRIIYIFFLHSSDDNETIEETSRKAPWSITAYHVTYFAESNFKHGDDDPIEKKASENLLNFPSRGAFILS